MTAREVYLVFGKGYNLSTTFVTTPRVPSEPIKNCFKSYPELSFISFFKEEIIVPSGRTASIPITKFRVIPYLKTLRPPALVEIAPPIWAEPLAPKFNGKSSSLSFDALIKSSNITPDSHVIVLAISSTSIILFIFSKDSTTWVLLDFVDPTRLVNPPWITTSWLFSLQIFIISDTCLVVFGVSKQTDSKEISVFQIW